MRRTSQLIAIVVALTLAAGLANAAPQGNYTWLTPAAGWFKMSRTAVRFPTDSLADATGFGARLGHQLGQSWGFELAGTYSPTKEAAGLKRDVTYAGLSGNLMYTLFEWRIGAPYIAAGYGWSFRTSPGFKRNNYQTFEQAVGWNAWFSDHAGLRLEFRNVLDLPYKNSFGAHDPDQQALAGLTWAWGGRPIDTDGDGVPDKKDKCPSTPVGATVDATGCPHDADGDGVWDGIDKCPGTPKGATVDATGCPIDTDGDGVWDGIDQCPNTPKGAIVDAKGCPIDTDGDGVWDGIDLCPGTPAGARVDATGCPIEVTEKETELLDTGMIRLQGVNFERGKSELLPESLPVLDQVGPILLKWPQLQIEVGGHADSTGSAGRNLTLSEARAASVRAYLLQKFTGIAEGQLTSKGYGSGRPVARNNSALNMAKNRRVEFVVLNKDVLKKEVERRKLLQK